MKQFIFTLFLAVGLTGASFASTADLFDVNEAAIEAQFEQIDAVESFVVANDITFTEMETEGHLAQFDLNWIAFPCPNSCAFTSSEELKIKESAIAVFRMYFMNWFYAPPLRAAVALPTMFQISPTAAPTK